MDAKTIQTILSNHGFPTRGIDGAIGPATKAAVGRFQAAYCGPNGWLDIDGNPGPKTQAALQWTQDNNSLVSYFSVDEVRCHGGNCCGGTCYVTREFLSALFHLRQLTGPLTVVDAYRCPIHNHAVGGASNSQHPAGGAFDPVKGKVNLTQAKQAGFHGIGLDSAGHVDHLDIRAGGIITFPDKGTG